MLDAANGGLGATLVPCPEPRSLCAAFSGPCLLTCCFQAVMYAVSATVSAYFFAMWKRADADVKSRVWHRYGWFSALALWGSCAGLVSAAADIQFRYILHRAAFSLKEDKCAKIKLEDYPDDPVQWFLLELDCYREQVSTYVQVFNRLSVQPVPYAIEFLCICCANLLVRLRCPLTCEDYLLVAARLCRPIPL